MSVTLLIAVLAQPTASMVLVLPPKSLPEVGSRELLDGRPAEAIARIEADRRLRNDPVARINLGSAHAKLGHLQLAKQNYRAAIRSDDRFDVQLHDGRVMDSREAAREAISRLELAVR